MDYLEYTISHNHYFLFIPAFISHLSHFVKVNEIELRFVLCHWSVSEQLATDLLGYLTSYVALREVE